nr:glycogen/starch/alpha-glucan phosphorylase [Marinicella sp. W31]MDC2876347.1 glycogen/starch/alpha-glucan phosphorylase [Marinicella sp. W31]
MSSGVFSHDDPSRYVDLIGGLYDHDWFMVAADFDAYAAAQREVDAIWNDQTSWNVKVIRNTARMGWFSSDRTIRSMHTTSGALYEKPGSDDPERARGYAPSRRKLMLF